MMFRMKKRAFIRHKKNEKSNNKTMKNEFTLMYLIELWIKEYIFLTRFCSVKRFSLRDSFRIIFIISKFLSRIIFSIFFSQYFFFTRFSKRNVMKSLIRNNFLNHENICCREFSFVFKFFLKQVFSIFTKIWTMKTFFTAKVSAYLVDQKSRVYIYLVIRCRLPFSKLIFV